VSTAETRDRIIGAARRLFHEQGYAATGVATILREAGVHPGSLYHHFADKEAVLSAVLETYPALLEPMVTGPVERATSDPIERVMALLAFYRRELVRTGCRMGCPIGNLALEVSDDHPDVRPLVQANFAAWTATVARWLGDAADRLPKGTDRDRLARFVLAVMEGAVMQARADDDLASFDAATAELRRHFELLEEHRTRRPRRPRDGRRNR
jgi:AcrR family transcriptional regulator